MTGDRVAKRATMSSMDILGPTLSAILKWQVRHRRKGLHAPKTGASRFLLLNATAFASHLTHPRHLADLPRVQVLWASDAPLGEWAGFKCREGSLPRYGVRVHQKGGAPGIEEMMSRTGLAHLVCPRIVGSNRLGYVADDWSAGRISKEA
jgi:hypothetical protein